MYTVVNSNTLDLITQIGKRFSSPEQRALQGAVALGIQPAMDYNNKDADDNTRAISTARTIGKIVAGTLVGVLVRKGSINLIKYASKDLNANEIANLKGIQKLKVLFTPKLSEISDELKIGDSKAIYENYTKTMGTILATIAMLFTNFLFDVPLTKAITKFLEPKVKEKIEKSKQVSNENN